MQRNRAIVATGSVLGVAVVIVTAAMVSRHLDTRARNRLALAELAGARDELALLQAESAILDIALGREAAIKRILDTLQAGGPASWAGGDTDALTIANDSGQDIELVFEILDRLNWRTHRIG